MAIHKIQIHKISNRNEKIIKVIMIVSGIVAIIIWLVGYLGFYQLFADEPVSNIISGILLSSSCLTIICLSLIVQSYVVEKKTYNNTLINKSYTNNTLEAFSLEGTIISIGLYLAPFGFIAGLVFIILGFVKLIN